MADVLMSSAVPLALQRGSFQSLLVQSMDLGRGHWGGAAPAPARSVCSISSMVQAVCSYHHGTHGEHWTTEIRMLGARQACLGTP